MCQEEALANGIRLRHVWVIGSRVLGSDSSSGPACQLFWDLLAHARGHQCSLVRWQASCKPLSQMMFLPSSPCRFTFLSSFPLPSPSSSSSSLLLLFLQVCANTWPVWMRPRLRSRAILSSQQPPCEASCFTVRHTIAGAGPPRCSWQACLCFVGARRCFARVELFLHAHPAPTVRLAEYGARCF